ncbi:MAG: ATP synthase F1 subunit gamma [Alphaproteobacteria bacterium]|nr:ATP synthase F1 subunit gamma [Alphaproteobacteria bacterium]
MAGLKELRTRIETIKSTQKITSAMKMVAVSRLRRVQNMLDKNEEYSENLRISALRVLAELQNEEPTEQASFVLPELLVTKAQPENYLMLVFSSDRGLCGSFNGNLTKKAAQRIRQLQKSGKNVQVICIGKKSYQGLKKQFADDNLKINLGDVLFKDASYAVTAEKISAYVLNKFKEGDFDACEAVYAHFATVLSRDFVCEQICPLDLNPDHLSKEQLKKINQAKNAFYEYLPDKTTILNNTLPLLFNNNIFKIIINSAVAEHSSRMTAMDNATRNATKIIGDLTLKYNSLRQSAITTELIEIIAGAEAI